MIEEKEIQRVLNHFERWMATPNRIVRCPLCLSPNRIELNRAILENSRSDKAIARELKVLHPTVRHHRIDCLRTRGGANIGDVDRSLGRLHQRFPTHAKETAQKKWKLDALLNLREESLKKSPPDRKELFRLVTAIDEAAAEWRKAKAEANGKAAEPKAREEDELDLSDEQKIQMRLVGKKDLKQEVNGARTEPAV